MKCADNSACSRGPYKLAEQIISPYYLITFTDVRTNFHPSQWLRLSLFESRLQRMVNLQSCMHAKWIITSNPPSSESSHPIHHQSPLTALETKRQVCDTILKLRDESCETNAISCKILQLTNSIMTDPGLIAGFMCFLPSCRIISASRITYRPPKIIYEPSWGILRCNLNKGTRENDLTATG